MTLEEKIAHLQTTSMEQARAAQRETPSLIPIGRHWKNYSRTIRRKPSASPRRASRLRRPMQS